MQARQVVSPRQRPPSLRAAVQQLAAVPHLLHPQPAPRLAPACRRSALPQVHSKPPPGQLLKWRHQTPESAQTHQSKGGVWQTARSRQWVKSQSAWLRRATSPQLAATQQPRGCRAGLPLTFAPEKLTTPAPQPQRQVRRLHAPWHLTAVLGPCRQRVRVSRRQTRRH